MAGPRGEVCGLCFHVDVKLELCRRSSPESWEGWPNVNPEKDYCTTEFFPHIDHACESCAGKRTVQRLQQASPNGPPAVVQMDCPSCGGLGFNEEIRLRMREEARGAPLVEVE